MQFEVRVGTRRSALALAQTRWVIERLREVSPRTDFQIVPLRTEGDIDRSTPLPQMGGRGVFVTEVERALRAKEVHFAVHSLKDLPTQGAEGLVVASVPVREDVRDALVTPQGVPLDQLGQGASVGTGSLRRQAQLARRRPDLRFSPIRGNVETRWQKVMDNEFDATVLAMAGLLRSKIWARAVPISVEELLPAAGQGALALQCREDDREVIQLLQSIDHDESHRATAAERRLLGLLRGGCHAPVGIYCRPDESDWLLEARVTRPDGVEQAEVVVRGDNPDTLANEAYRRLQSDPVVQKVISDSSAT